MKPLTFSDIAAAITNAKTYTLFTVGDSITHGGRATSDNTTYTAVLGNLLAARYPERTVKRYDGRMFDTADSELRPLKDYAPAVTIQQGGDRTISVVRSGVGGNTVKRLLSRSADFVNKTIDHHGANLFFINAGINDAIREDPQKFAAPDEYTADLHLLITRIQEAHPDAAIVLMTPTYNDSGNRNTSVLDPYAVAMRNVAKDRGLPLIDLHAVWMQHLQIGGKNYGQDNWLSGVPDDRCHPSDHGHAVIANIIFRHIFNEQEDTV
ncbi:MAG: hypothetical protein E7552_00395 [Ruminococcaceae bacterium]|nr:hypothetical protein [Oscillospiraceae bacterium]